MVEVADETVTCVEALATISGLKDDVEEEVAVFVLDMILRIELLDVDDDVVVVVPEGEA